MEHRQSVVWFLEPHPALLPFVFPEGVSLLPKLAAFCPAPASYFVHALRPIDQTARLTARRQVCLEHCRRLARETAQFFQLFLVADTQFRGVIIAVQNRSGWTQCRVQTKIKPLLIQRVGCGRSQVMVLRE